MLAIGDGSNALPQKVFSLWIFVNIGNMSMKVYKTGRDHKTLCVNKFITRMGVKRLTNIGDTVSFDSNASLIRPRASAINDRGVLNKNSWIDRAQSLTMF